MFFSLVVTPIDSPFVRRWRGLVDSVSRLVCGSEAGVNRGPPDMATLNNVLDSGNREKRDRYQLVG